MTRDPPLADSMSAGLIDRAETFAESDVTVNHTATQTVSESIELHLSVSDTFVTSRSSNVFDRTEVGVEISPNETLEGVEADVAGSGDWSDGFDEVRLTRVSDDTILETDTSAGFGDTVRFERTLSSTENYYITAYDSSATSDPPEMSDSSASTATFDVPGGFDSGGTAGVFAFDAVRSLQTATSGSPTIEWSSPTDIYRWDSVLFQATPDGETVTVDVQESTDGGSTWTTIATDVSRGQEITADPANEVRLKVNLSRSDTANNPTLDAAYRRYVI